VSRILRVGLAQFDAAKSPAANLARIAEFTEQAVAQHCRLVVFPEASMASFEATPGEVAQPLDGTFFDGLRDLARRQSVLLVVGCFEPAEDGRVYNMLFATDGEGIEERYRKIHLFDALGTTESATVAPGNEMVVFDALGTRIGLATCYDVRFAALFTALGKDGAEVICLPASWADGATKAEQWDVLIRARAMDAQAWVLAADQSAHDTGGRKPLGIGRSAVVDPLGVVTAREGGDESLLIADIELDRVGKVRAAVPILQ